MTPSFPSDDGAMTPRNTNARLSPEDRPLLRVVSNADLKRQEDQKIAANIEAARALQLRSKTVQELAAYLRKLWDDARNERNASGLDDRLIECLHTRKSEYTPEKLARIREFGGADVFAGITASKVRAISSWLRDVLVDQPEKPWGVEPTPVPELGPDTIEELMGIVEVEIQSWMMQTGIIPQQEIVNQYYRVLYDELYNRVLEEAKVRAHRMELLIEDQMVEGDFARQFSMFIDDYCTFPAAVFKGPIPLMKRDLKWQMGPNGVVEPGVTEKVKVSFKRVSPFDIYPSPNTETVQQGYLFEKHRLSASELYNYIGVPGYSEEAIRAVLEEGEQGGLSDWLTQPIDYQRMQAEDRTALYGSSRREAMFDALEFWGPVSGRMLREWGMRVEDPQRVYEICALLIKDWVIFAEVNPNPMGKRPYYKACYDPVPGAFWGQSLKDILDDAQQIVNASARAMVNNMAFASGPMVGVNVERLAPGTAIDNIQPWQVFKFQNDPMGGNGGQAPPLEFFQPQSNVNELMAMMEKYYQLADDLSGMPRYMQGVSNSASRTASGLSMLMNAASKGLRQLIATIDREVLSQVVEATYTHNMLFHPDPGVKGDLCVVARGASAIVHKEAVQARRNEFLGLTANPVDMQIMGPQGRASLLREAAKGLDIDPNTIVPSLDKERFALASMAMMGAKGMGPGGGPQAPQGGEQLQDGMGTPTTDEMGPVPQGGGM